jgi:hypothetical protein
MERLTDLAAVDAIHSQCRGSWAGRVGHWQATKPESISPVTADRLPHAFKNPANHGRIPTRDL